MRSTTTIVCALAAFAAGAGGTAAATGLIRTSNIAKGAVTLNRLSPDVQKMLVKKPAAGANGVDGVSGVAGAAGPAGAAGTTGETGVTGAQGLKGDQGVAGAQGLKGDKGDPGAQGPAGSTGSPGATGAAGAPGATGAAGPAGPQGPTGNAGTVHQVVAGSLDGFVLAPDDGHEGRGPGTAEFVTAANAPLGSKVLDLATTTGAAGAAYLPAPRSERLLSELSAFSYSSKLISAASPNGRPLTTVRIDVSWIGPIGDHELARTSTLVYDPWHNGDIGSNFWRRYDVLRGSVYSTTPLPSGHCSEAAPCLLSQFIEENPHSVVVSAKFQVGTKIGQPQTDAAHDQVDDVVYGFETPVTYDLGA